MTENFAPATDGGPRAWRDRPVYQTLIGAVRSGEAPDPDDLRALLAEVQPNDPEAFVKDVVGSAGMAVELDESGAKGEARELARERAAAIDERFETTDHRRDQSVHAKADRRAAREQTLDPTALTAGVPDSRVRA